MKIVYAQKSWHPDDAKKGSVFLAGPTPREHTVPSWRPEALQILKGLGFQGAVFVPEDEVWGMSGSKEQQIAWEWHALCETSVIAFWVPRDIHGGMPAFTTNVEFGMFVGSGKAILGYPESANKMSYLRFHADRVGMFVTHDIQSLLVKAVSYAS